MPKPGFTEMRSHICLICPSGVMPARALVAACAAGIESYGIEKGPNNVKKAKVYTAKMRATVSSMRTPYGLPVPEMVVDQGDFENEEDRQVGMWSGPGCA